jgi:hypothetical protein
MNSNLLYGFTQVVLDFFEDIDTPISLGLYLRVKSGLWREAIAISVSPLSYLTPDAYFRDSSACAFIRKCAGLPTKVDKRLAAIEKWKQGERDCYLTNERLTRYLPEFSNSSDTSEGILKFFEDVKKQIVSWIGFAPPRELLGRFGPGATSTDRGWNVTVPHKMSNAPSFTREALQHLPEWARTSWARAVSASHGEISVVRGNRFSSVPKTALTDRSIAAEPSVNIFYQLAVGRAMKERLKRSTGVDLALSQPLHKILAQTSSRSGHYCTLDLSNASDTVSSVLVRLVMTDSWMELLNSLRSRWTLLDGQWYLLEKFSSMGNGFTFELETLIFAAIACVVARQHGHQGQFGLDVFCFGDDIILPDDCYHTLSRVLKFCGFEVNPQKSFHGISPFRESCGGDYFHGHDVRPYFVKELPNEPQHWISIANGINRVSRILDPFRARGRFRSWYRALDNLPSRIRSCRGPEALGDLAIHDDPVAWNSRTVNSIRSFRVYRPARTKLVRYSQFTPEVVLACAVYGAGGGVEGGVTP